MMPLVHNRPLMLGKKLKHVAVISVFLPDILRDIVTAIGKTLDHDLTAPRSDPGRSCPAPLG